MTLTKFLADFTRRLRPSGTTATLAALALSGAGLTAITLAAAQEDGEALITNVSRFQIPFDVESAPGEPAKGFAVLFGSQDGGAHWQQLQSVPVDQGAFNFSAPRDGNYGFAIRITDEAGRLPESIAGSTPELEVIVDTVAPELKLDLAERSPGEVLITWTSADASVAAETLAIEFADGADGRWKPVDFRPGASGQAVVSASPGSVVSVRAAITDTAGNRSDVNSQLVLRASAPNAGSSRSFVPANPGLPLGPTPFAESPGQVPSAPGSGASASPVTGPAGQSVSGTTTAASGAPTGNAAGNSFAAAGPQLPGHGGVPVVSPSGSAAALPDPSGGLPMVGETAGADAQIVNSQAFDLEYQVEEVGLSGVSAVELFVTEDGGRQWFRYGTDADQRSPFPVDTQGEGTFGFAVRVRNGLGIADNPPQPGQLPEIIVTVDQTAPQVEFTPPTLRSEGLGTLVFGWQISEQHPAAASVRLEYATAQSGPWTPVFDWQQDQGGYQWAVRPGMPPAMYFRLLARDAAGNVGTSQTPQPVLVDLKKPVGRLLRVHSVSQSSAWPQ